MSDFIESIFQSVDILIDKKLENLSYDTTIICTITDNTDKKDGKYRVTDGSVSFIAYSELTNYRIGDQVRVNIPQGDMTQQKFIIGKYSTNENMSPIAYVSPTESVINVSGNLTANLGEFSIAANGDIKNKIIWNQTFSPENFRDLQSNGIYNILILKADFKTLMNEYKYISGTYGLRIDLLIRPAIDSNIRIKQTVELSNKDMFGNSYNYSIYTPQAKTFTISTAGIIEGAEISLFQNGDFKNDKNIYVKPPLGYDNIFIKNIEFGFGSNLKDIEDNSVKIYCQNSLKYNHDPHDNSTNLKKIGLVWYNKDENDKYIGFSDGIYDPTYNEFDYLAMSNFDMDLINKQKELSYLGPKDKMGLTFAVHCDISEKTFQDILKIFTNSINGEYTSFYTLLPQDNFRTGIQTVINQISSLTNTLSNEIDNLVQQYNVILNYAIAEDKTNEPAIELSQYEIIDTTIEEIIKVVNNPVNSKCSSGYQEYYDNLMLKVQRFVDNIRILQQNITEVITNTFTIESKTYFEDLKNNKILTEYGKEDLSRFNNKYAIYWYRYEEGYIDETKKSIMPDGWKLLTEEELRNPSNKDVPYNSLPSMQVDKDNNPILTDEGNQKYNIFFDDGESFIYQYMNPDLPTQKYIALICYNHNIYKSNELIFENSQELKDLDLADKSDALEIEHGQSSNSVYPLYNEIYYLKNSIDEFTPREIMCHYNGVIMKDEALINSRVYWYIPKESTMIAYNIEELEALGFDSDLSALFSESRQGYVCFYKTIKGSYSESDGEKQYNFINNGYDDRKFQYKIKPYLDQNAAYNHIICKVIPENKTLAVQTTVNFTFSIAGNCGTPYTLSIVNKKLNESALTPSKPLELEVQLRGEDNKIIELDDSHKLDVTWYAIRGIDTTVTNNTGINVAENIITIVNSKMTGILKITTNIKIPTNEEKTEFKTVQLQTLHSIPLYVSNTKENWHLSGATQITYNHVGSLDPTGFYTGPYVITDLNTHTPVNDINWRIEPYNRNFEGVCQEETTDGIYYQYAPSLTEDNRLEPSPMYLDTDDYISFVVGEKDSNNYYIQPIIINQNRYASKFLNDWTGNFQIDEEGGTLMSAMVGAGRKTNDNKFEGVLLGNVSYGTNTFQNSDTYKKSPPKSGIGLYGYHQGVQSFGFNIDGTAFIGHSGGGRISFDGSKGIIASGNWFGTVNSNGTISNQGTSGMCIDLSNGHIDAYNFKLSSSTIFLNSNPNNSEDYMKIGNDNTYIQFTKNGALNLVVDSFQLRSGGTNQSIGDIADNTITGSKIINKLDGQQGFYMQNGKLYISADYIKTGTIVSNNYDGYSVGMAINLDYGSLWTPYAQISSEGKIYATGGEVGGWTITSKSLYADANGSRTYMQIPNEDQTWIFSVQKKTSTGYDGVFYVDQTGWLKCSGLAVYAPEEYAISFFFQEMDATAASDGEQRYIQLVSGKIDVTGGTPARREAIYSPGGLIIQSRGALWLESPSVRMAGTMFLNGYGSGYLWVDNKGEVWPASIDTSLQKYKEFISQQFDKDLDPVNLYNLPIVQFKFKDKCFDDNGKEIYIPNRNFQVGLIAEDVEKYFPSACIYSNNKLQGWRERLLVPAMLKLIQDQKKDIDYLYSKLEDLINGEKGE